MNPIENLPEKYVYPLNRKLQGECQRHHSNCSKNDFHFDVLAGVVRRGRHVNIRVEDEHSKNLLRCKEEDRNRKWHHIFRGEHNAKGPQHLEGGILWIVTGYY